MKDTIKLPPPTPISPYDIPDYFNWGCDMEEENTRCKDCLFLNRYVDMGMSCDMCSIIGGLENAIQATRCKGKCPNKLTAKEACKYVERRNKHIKENNND